MRAEDNSMGERSPHQHRQADHRIRRAGRATKELMNKLINELIHYLSPFFRCSDGAAEDAEEEGRGEEDKEEEDSEHNAEEDN